MRGVRPCSGLSGNIRCHKVSPCSTRARGSMYPRPARLRPCAAQPHKGSAPRNITSAPRPPPCRMTMRRGLVAPGSLRSRLRRSRCFSTLFCNRAVIFPPLKGGIRTPPRRRLRSRPTARLEIETLRFCRSGKEFPKPGAVRLPAGRSKERCSGLSVFFEAFFSQRAFLTPWGRLRPARRLSVQFSSGGCSARFFAELAAVLAASSGGKGAAGR